MAKQDLLDADTIGSAPARKSKKQPENTSTTIPVSGLFGLGILFVAISIGYANYIVFFGTDDLISKIMLIPSTLFVAVFLLLKALK